MILAAGFMALLHRFTGQVIPTGINTSNRKSTSLKNRQK